MTVTRRGFVAGSAALLTVRRARALVREGYDVRAFGAKGDGRALDTAAFNRAIEAAAVAGGGIVDVSAGSYLCFTLHLRSHIELRFAPGAVLIAATPGGGQQYDLPEPQPAAIAPYQDFGHNHWHNSLLWGEGLTNVAVTGPGELWGRGLQKGDHDREESLGAGNKILALKNCRNVVLRDLSLRAGGHFGVLATAVDNLTIDNLRIDTGRDGIDIDSCRNVHIRGCTVNAPFDDAIVLKSSLSLGVTRSTEQVTISDCTVTGSYAVGSALDGTQQPIPAGAAGGYPARVGRIKIGTETNGDIRNIVVSNCAFHGCHGLAVISEDGGAVEDCSFSNITMRDNVGPPVFVRLGGRNREPAPEHYGAIRRISFAEVDCVMLDDLAIDRPSGDACSSITGVPGHPVEDITITNLRVRQPGGGVVRRGEVPEALADYPEPKMFGSTPAHGFYLRHAARLEFRDVRVEPVRADARPLVVMDDVHIARLKYVRCAGASCTSASEQVSQMDCSDITIL
jgi:polygalacturonase